MLKSKNTFLILASLVPLSLFLSSGFINVSVVLILIYCLFNVNGKIYDSLKVNKALLLPVILFLAYACGLLYSDHLDDGIKTVTRKLPLLLLPLSFLMVNKRLTDKEFDTILSVLLLSCLGVSLFCYSRAIINIVENQTIIYPDNLYRMYYFAYLPLTQPFEPIYLSIFANLAFVIVLKSSLIRSNLVKTCIAIYIGIFIILIASKGGIISFALILLALLITKKNKKILSYTLLVAIIPLFLFAICKFPFLKERFTTSFTVNFEEKNGGLWNSNNLRLAIWSSAIDAIKDSPIVGYGPGDGQMALEEAYQAKGFAFGLFYKTHPGIPQYNPHNEFISASLDIGLIGLTILLFIVGFGFIYSIGSKDFLLFSFMVVILISFSTESLLLRQKGIVFFAFYYSFMIWYRNNIKNEADSIASVK